MRYSTRVILSFNRLQRRYRVAADKGLYQVSALIRLEARQSMRKRAGPAQPGKPPHAHSLAGLREINFDVRGNSAIIGPRKFPRSNFFNRPVPNIHEKGGVAISLTLRRRAVRLYPERSFMWTAVKRLRSNGKIQKRFNVALRSM